MIIKKEQSVSQLAVFYTALPFHEIGDANVFYSKVIRYF